jgi:hypothetical protein
MPSINLFEINPYTPSLPSRHKEYFCILLPLRRRSVYLENNLKIKEL